MKPHFPTALVCWAAFAIAAQGAEESFLIDTWDSEQGLPNSTVTGVMQAPDGYLWLSTLSGLARFDGSRFANFVGPWSPGVSLGDLNDIAVDSSGGVWTMASDGELVFRDEAGFQTLKPSAPGNAVRSLQTDNSGAVWAALASGAIARCSGAKVEAVPQSEGFGGLRCAALTFPDGSAWLVTSNGVLMEWNPVGLQELHPPGTNSHKLVGVSGDGLGSVWVLGEREIWQWRDQQWIPVTLPGTSSVSFRGLRTGRDGSLWVWNEEGVWRLAQGEWTSAKGPWPPMAGGFDPVAQLIDAEGRAWFSILGQGLVAVSADGSVTVLSVQQGLPSNFIRCLALDREGDVWAGTQRGLVRIKPKRLKVISWGQTHVETQATGLVEGPDGRLWIGSYGDGLFALDTTVNASQAMAAFTAPKFCRALVFDRQDRLWAGTSGEGLWMMEKGRMAPAPDAPLPLGQARSLLVDSRGRLWIGSMKGLFSLENGKLAPHPLPGERTTVDARSIIENKDGSLWVGTERIGLLRWRDNVWDMRPVALPASLLSIWSLYQDGEGDLWIGTQNGGLARWRAGHLDLFNRTNGLGADTICSILEDNQQNLWLGTYEGVFRLRKRDCNAVASGQTSKLEPEVFNRSDGMPTLQCSGSFQPAACRTRDGRLCFPTVKGVVIFDPKLEAPSIPPPPVVIEEVGVGQRSLAAKPGLSLGTDPKHIAFRFTALSFAQPERVRFRYRLVGEDKEWIEAGTDRAAVFDSLRPGRHEFQVTAAGADGIWNQSGASLGFTVVPLWWQTWWFQGGAICGAILLGTALLRQGLTRRLKHRLELAERRGALHRERSRIARDIHDELGTSLTRIIMLSQLDDEETDPSHQKLALSRIHQTAGNLTRAMDEVVWAVNPRQDTLEALIGYLSMFAQEFISAANLVCRLDLPPSVPPLPLSAEVRHSIFLAAKEAINNAVRHAQAREIRISLRTGERSFTLEVADDGIGFEAGQMAMKGDGLWQARGGNGLRNIRERLGVLGGRCDIESVPNKGTLLRFVVPWPPAAM